MQITENNNLLDLLQQGVTKFRSLREPISAFLGRAVTFKELACSGLMAEVPDPALNDLKKIAEIFDQDGLIGSSGSREARLQDAAVINHVLGSVRLIPLGCGELPTYQPRSTNEA